MSISKEYFDRLDLRVGRIVRAERIPRARKLLKLVVDVGEERTIVSGIAELYKPEDLVGKYVVVVANLEPRNIFGVESQGMILATCGERPVLVTLEDVEKVKVGEKVC